MAPFRRGTLLPSRPPAVRAPLDSQQPQSGGLRPRCGEPLAAAPASTRPTDRRPPPLLPSPGPVGALGGTNGKSSSEWIRLQLAAHVAFSVGVEDEATMIDASEQHHSGGRAPIRRGCGNCHRLKHGLASCPRNVDPPGQLGQRIRMDGRFVLGHNLLARGSASL